MKLMNTWFENALECEIKSVLYIGNSISYATRRKVTAKTVKQVAPILYCGY